MLLHDLRSAFRALIKSPVLTCVAMITLALGVGASNAIFSYVNAWMIKPLPYPHASQLVVFLSHDKKKGWSREALTSTASVLEVQRRNSTFEHIVLWTGSQFSLNSEGEPWLVEGGRVNWDFFNTLGAHPILGRTFLPSEDRVGTEHVVVLSEGLWRDRFGAQVNIIGRQVLVDGIPHTVVGVMSRTFQFPLMGMARLWTPLTLSDRQRADHGSSPFCGAGRLRSGISIGKANAEVASQFENHEKQFPGANTNLTLLINSMTDEIRRKEGTAEVMICFYIVGLILLIACSNVANLMLARGSARVTEFAVRASLGATRNVLVRQLLIESLLLFLLGGVLGSFLGLEGARWIESQIPSAIRGYLVDNGHVQFDLATLTFTFVVVTLCGIAFGLAPALENSKPEVSLVLKEGRASGTRHRTRLRRGFVAAEIALAILVLIATTLLVKSFIFSVSSDPGYNAVNVFVAQISLPQIRYADALAQRGFSDALLARLHIMPGVVSSAAASSVPFGIFGSSLPVEPTEAKWAPEDRPRARFTAASVGYFSTMQIQVLRGRTFLPADAQGVQAVAVIGETLAREFWPNRDPIGHQLRFGDPQTICTVIGVVRDVKTYQLRARPERQFYVPLTQFPSSTLAFVVRASVPSTRVVSDLEKSVWAVDRSQPVFSIEPLENLMAQANAGNRILTKLMIVFAVIAMFLGIIGIYGVMSDLVAQRTREMAVRTAVGATQMQLMGLVVGQGLTLTAVGAAVGVLSALAATRVLGKLLYQVRPNDPITFLVVPIGFAIVACAACCIPARKALRAHPILALR